MTQKNDRLASFYACLAMLCWSTVAVAFKTALKSLSPAQLLLIANYISFLTLLTLVIFQRKTQISLHQTGRQALYSLFLGFLNPFFYYLVLFEAYSLLPAQVAQPINFTWPIMLILLSVPLLGQKLKLINFLALLISFSGVLILSLQGRITSFTVREPGGVLLALSSSVIWALYWIFNIRDKRDDQVKLMMNFLFASIYITIYCFFSGELKGISRSGILPAMYAGVFEMGITFVFWIKALQYSTKTARVTNLIYLSPFLSLIFIRLFLHETIYLTSILGLLLILSGILLQQYRSK